MAFQVTASEILADVSTAIKIANILSHHLQRYIMPKHLVPLLPKFLKRTCLTVQSLGELVDCRGNLQTLVQNGTLPLQADVTRPFHKACQITLGLNILACGNQNDPPKKSSI